MRAGKNAKMNAIAPLVSIISHAVTQSTIMFTIEITSGSIEVQSKKTIKMKSALLH